MHVEVPSVPRGDLLARPRGEPSAAVRARAVAARAVALRRQGVPNAALAGAALDAHCAIDDAGRVLLGAAIEKLDLSARAVPRLLRLARTIADLAGAASPAPEHVAEAIGYRRFG